MSELWSAGHGARWFARAVNLFVVPAAPREVVAPPPADLVGVLAPAGDLAAVAGGVAHALRSRTAVVCRPGAAAAPAPATAAARRLARRLGARDHAVTTAGTLCHVSLPGDPESAIRELWRLAAALDRTPLVLALSTRNEAFDAVLAQLDRLSLSAPADVAELALASLSALGPPTQLVAPPSGPIARRLAALGLTAARPVPKEIAA